MSDNKLNPAEQYCRERDERIESYKQDKKLTSMADAYIKELAFATYSANFSWLGRSVIQIPQDLMAFAGNHLGAVA